MVDTYSALYSATYDDTLPDPPGGAASWRVEVRDTSLAVIGQADVWTVLKITLRHRRAGGWTLTLPASHDQAALFAEGGGIIVWAPWSVSSPLMSGPVTRLTVVTPGADAPALLTIDGVDDTGLLADRIVLPDPTSDPDDQGDEAYYTLTAAAEEAIRTLVDVNAGDSALTGRRMCDAQTPAADPVGTSRSIKARFDNLLTLVDQLATTDNLTVRLIQPPGVADRVLEVGASTDRSASVRLSQPAGTLTAATAVLSAPTATSVLVAGGGEGEARVLVERTAPALVTEWGRRIETFRDARDTSDLVELAERGDETLADATQTAGLNLTPLDLPAQQFGVHYGLGDTVTVDVAGTSYTDVITAVEITVDAAGGTVTVPSVGDADAADDKSPLIYTRVRDLTRRLEALERRQ